jgi:hypothetical protein
MGATVGFSDDLHGWVDLGATGGGYLYSTSDGGKTWQRPKGDSGLGVSIAALTSEDAFFAGGVDHLLYATHDGGRTIKEISLPNPPSLDSGYFPIYSLPEFATALQGYETVNYRGRLGSPSAAAVFSTQDGGRSWAVDRLLLGLDEGDQVDSGVADSTWTLPFARLGSSTLTAISVYPRDTKSAPEGGEGSAPLRSCKASFISDNDGWTYCPGTLFSTRDGGRMWTNITPKVRGGALTADPVTPTPTRTLTPKAVPLATLAKPRSSATALASSHPYSQQLAFDSTSVLTTAEMQTLVAL